MDCIGLVITSSHRESTAVACCRGKLVGAYRSDSLNHHAVLHGDLVLSYSRILAQLLSPLDCPSVTQLSDVVEFLLLCLPGGATLFDQQVAKSLLVRCGWSESALGKIRVVDDTWAGAVACSSGREVIYGIADAGASVFVHTGRSPAGRISKFDGWGALLGDYGSKFQLALDALRLICRELDYGRRSNLLALLEEADHELRTLPDLQLWFDTLLDQGHTRWRHKVADLAVPLLHAADESPAEYKEALQLIHASACSFADNIDIAIRSFSPASHRMRIVVSGGMMTSRAFRDRLEYEVQQRWEKSVARSTYSILGGAVLMAFQQFDLNPPAPNGWEMSAIAGSAPDELRALLYEPWCVDGVAEG